MHDVRTRSAFSVTARVLLIPEFPLRSRSAKPTKQYKEVHSLIVHKNIHYIITHNFTCLILSRRRDSSLYSAAIYICRIRNGSEEIADPSINWPTEATDVQ